MGAFRRIRQAARPLLDQYSIRRCDVIVVSFPKAGRTWLRMLMGQALADHFALTDRSVEDILAVTPLAKGRRDIPLVLFTHDGNPQGSTPQEILATSKRPYRNTAVILLARDPRDVIVSLFFQKSRRKNLQQQSGATEPIGAFIRGERGGFESILTFYKLWFDSRELPRRFLLLRYEDLHADPHGSLRDALELAGVADVRTETIERAVAASRFDEMRRLETSGALSAEALTPGQAGDPESYKTRKGEVGGYRAYASPADVAWMATAMADLPSEFGYPPTA